MVAGKVDGTVRFGYSKCHKNDRFVKKTALKMATERMNKTAKDYTTELPPSMFEDFKRFTNRVDKVFK
jgi:hypothetical protein